MRCRDCRLQNQGLNSTQAYKLPATVMSIHKDLFSHDTTLVEWGLDQVEVEKSALRGSTWETISFYLLSAAPWPDTAQL